MKCRFFKQFGPFFYGKRKARQDKMFILTLTLYCTSKSCKIQVAKVATKRKASRIGDHVGRNFEPCYYKTKLVQRPNN